MKAKSTFSRSGSSAFELIFFLIVLGLGMYWVTMSLMPEDKKAEGTMIERSSMIKAAEFSADALSERRQEQDELIRQISVKTDEEREAK